MAKQKWTHDSEIQHAPPPAKPRVERLEQIRNAKPLLPNPPRLTHRDDYQLFTTTEGDDMLSPWDYKNHKLITNQHHKILLDIWFDVSGYYEGITTENVVGEPECLELVHALFIKHAAVTIRKCKLYLALQALRKTGKIGPNNTRPKPKTEEVPS